MAIDSLNKVSNEQLLAMSMLGNGQVTNDSDSDSDSSDSIGSTGDEKNLAFQMVMQNLLDSSKKSNQSTANESNAVADAINGGIASTENSNGKNNANTVNGSNNVNKVIQTYMTGQDLEDLPMILKSNYVNFTKNSDSVLSKKSDADQKKIYTAVENASKKYGVDSNLILAIIKQESDFDPNSTSGVGAAGLMQIMPQNFSQVGVKDAYDVDQNVNGGTKLLKEYLDKYNGNTEMALMAYNGGPGTMQKRGVSSADDLYKMPQETQNYVPKVMGYYRSGV